MQQHAVQRSHTRLLLAARVCANTQPRQQEAWVSRPAHGGHGTEGCEGSGENAGRRPLGPSSLNLDAAVASTTDRHTVQPPRHAPRLQLWLHLSPCPCALRSAGLPSRM
jgi:hypothetical protein